ncbi:chromodomain-helicase-DNA-binding protein 8-like [Hypanus sabinus]|uniref:chromodomain-helicase-DNA-binding protein 8-like n=1 Tax=Hypanus sabinus TaxID=79690 RepID=UPI0028C4CB89|nr:chromodomain-helicase-DNA-binding protein 8-like [Hypanus sabinus]
MADHIMDLFDDPGLFAEGLESLTAGSIADELDLGEGFDGLPPFPTGTPEPAPQTAPFPTFPSTGPLWAQPPAGGQSPSAPPAPEPEYLVHHDYALQQSGTGEAAPAPAPVPSPTPSPSPAPAQPALLPFPQPPEAISQGNPFMGVQDSQQEIPAATSSPSASGPTEVKEGAPVQSVGQEQQPASSSTTTIASSTTSSSPAVQYNIRYTLPGQPTPNGGVVVPQGAVLASTQTVPYVLGQPQESQSNGAPLGQVVLQPVAAQQSTATLSTVKPNVTIAPSPASQGDPKRITLVLQQPPGSSQPGQRHLMMRTLPGKILIQGQQLTALAQGQAAKGQAGKVVTIQLQLQNPQQKLQPCQMFLQQPVTVATTAAPQQPQGVRQQAQAPRLTVPLQVSLQQPVQPQVSVPTVSVVAAQVSGTVNEQQRKLEHQKKQEKANRIVAEAIARAKARGEQNIPRVLAHGELSGKAPGPDSEDKRRKKKSASRSKDADGKKSRSSSAAAAKAGSSSSVKGKGKSKLSTITPVIGKKRKKTGSSEENSDVERSPAHSSKDDEESATQKRRSNRQVKRKKYTEDLDLKITDDEDEEVDVMGPVKMPPMVDVDTSLQTMQLFVENPSEEDAAIVDKILSFRVAKKEVYQGQYMEVEEFYVKYKNYSYLHCEWATLQQLEKDKRIHQKIKRFKAKMAQMRHIFHEDEDPFNPDYIEVDRLLEESHSVDKDNGEPVVYYLVKWCSLPYEDSTWELKEDVDEAKIEEFERLQARKPKLTHVERPPAKAWKKLDQFREYKNDNQLREYQLEGVNWLLFNWYNRQNCILADEMGLGKTIQSITFLEEVYSAGIQGPFLVIAPLSTITNWEREFSTWTDMNAIVYHGSLASRQMIQQYEMYFRDPKGHFIPGAYRFDALITTFEMILSDCPELREIAWRCVIIDEAHRLKNRNCKLLEGLKLMELCWGQQGALADRTDAVPPSSWGRWKDILAHGRFKRRMSERDVEVICRTILVYCLLHYRGDEKIKGFIWDLITPTENGQTKELQNHSGLSAPVPRGRKGKKIKSQSSSFDVQKADWIRKCNPDVLLQDDSYKKHLKHHCNKVLLRVRMLYYLKQEVIGDQSDRVLDGADTNDIDVWIPEVDGMEVPAEWWDMEADKSLLIGVFKHGYEKYNTMRADPALCFLEQVGRPDEKAIAAEQRGMDMFGDLGDGGDFERDLEDPEYKPLILGREHRDDDGDGMVLDEDISVDGDDGEARKDVLMGAGLPSQCRYWPMPSVLTARLRRLVTAYQRSYKQEQQKMEAAERGDRKRRRCEAAFKLKEIARREKQQKWTGREESDFYRAVSTFGVEFEPHTRRYRWDRFRDIARLERKTDETLTRYLQMFMAMCRRVCGLPLEEGEEYPEPSLLVRQLTEERATRALYRIDLLRRVREQVLCHPLLAERLQLCQPSAELPGWWESGRHDLELLQGAARHGLRRAHARLLCDPCLSFRACRLAHLQGHPPSPACCPVRGTGGCSPPPGDWERETDSDLDRSSLADSCPSSSEESDGDGACAEARSLSKNYDEESTISLNTSRDETQDGFPSDELEPSLGNLLHDKQLPVPSWPKDRVLINRINMVCHTVLNGCWPTPRRAQCDPARCPQACPGTPSLVESPEETPVPTPGSLTIDEDTPSASFTKVKKHAREKEFTVKINNEDGLKLTFHKQRRRPRKPEDEEGEGSRGPEFTPSQSASDSGPETECPRTTLLTPSALLDHSFPLREGGSPNPHTVRCQLDAVLSAGSSPLWRHSVNGQLAGAQSLGKKRRGRRRNVERGELLQPSPSQGLCTANGEVERTMEEPQTQPRRPEPDMETRIPVVSKLDGTVLAGDEAPRRRELDQWLKLNPDFAVDPSCLAFVEDRPKQKRHRCRNPHKLDVNTLTGEERVPVINRRNGKKLGGGFAPPIKDLQKWLQDNSEYGVAQEWADVIKQSGFLAEDMYDRILSGPVVPEEGRKRGRRPKHLTAALQVNSLLEGGGLRSLQQELPPLQLPGLVGYPQAPAPTQSQTGLSEPPPGPSLPLSPLLLPAVYGGGVYLGPGATELSLGALDGARGLGAVRVEGGAADDHLSQGYDSGEEGGGYCHSLMGDPMMPTNSDLSGED